MLFIYLFFISPLQIPSFFSSFTLKCKRKEDGESKKRKEKIEEQEQEKYQ